MNRRGAGRFIPVVAFFFCMFLGFYGRVAAETYDLAWPEFAGERSEIFYSMYRDGKWGEKQQLTNDQFNNMHPEMVADQEGRVWLAWTGLNGLENKLFYAVQENGKWSYPREVETGLESSIGPSLCVDQAGGIWLAWAGYAGVADDVYVSRWNGQGWEAPMQVNPVNSVPDILPEIAMNEEMQLEVRWQGYDGDLYQHYRAVLLDSTWTAPEVVEAPEEAETDPAVSSEAKFGKKGIPMPDFFHPIKNDSRLYHLMAR